MKHYAWIGLVVIGLVLTGCTRDFWQLHITMADKSFVNYEVEFNARAGGNTGPLAVFSPNKNCSVPAGKSRQGCVAFEHNTYGAIKFSLRNEGNSNNTACGDSGVRWVITKVEATTTVDPADDNKGTAWGAALAPWVTSAFFPIEDAGEGLIYESVMDDASTSIVLLNRNNSTTEEILYYRVTASRCGSNPVDTKVSDPQVQNKGLN